MCDEARHVFARLRLVHGPVQRLEVLDDAVAQDLHSAVEVRLEIVSWFLIEDDADVLRELLDTDKTVIVYVALQHRIFEDSRFNSVETEAGVLKDILHDVVANQGCDEMGPGEVLDEELTPAVLTAVGDPGDVGHKLRVFDAELREPERGFEGWCGCPGEMLLDQCMKFLAKGKESVCHVFQLQSLRVRKKSHEVERYSRLRRLWCKVSEFGHLFQGRQPHLRHVRDRKACLVCCWCSRRSGEWSTSWRAMGACSVVPFFDFRCWALNLRR